MQTGDSFHFRDRLDFIRLTGITTVDGRGDEVGLPPGTAVMFLRRNVRDIG